MFTPILLAALLSAPQVRLAPDQPLPYVFSDEPVIVEFRGEENLDFDVMIAYGTGQFPSNSHGLGPIALRAGHPYWTTTNLDPVRYGVHAITLNLQWPTGSEKYDFTLQRIRRPDIDNPPPLVMRIPDRSGPWEQICRVLPAGRVSIQSTHPDLESLLTAFQREDIEVIMLLRGDYFPLTTKVAPSAIAIPADTSLEGWARKARELRERFPSMRVTLENPTPEFLVALLRSGAVQLIHSISVESVDALIANRDAAEHQGYENLPFSVSIASAANMLPAAEAWNAGAYLAEISLEPLWFEDALTPEFGMLNAALHLCDQTRVAGRYSDGPVETVLLRHIEPENRGRWIAPVALTAGLASAVEYADENGNVHTSPPTDVAFALGTNPDIVLEAIAFEIREEAKKLRQMEAVMSVLSGEVERAVVRLTECEGMESMRAEFFSLLRALPTLEQTWHAGDLLKSDAVPAIASVERLVRRLAALEQALGIPFVEPIEETLDRCADQQSLYLTATVGPGASAERGERLMMHISSLITQARTLHHEGRLIEGDAIAALAEWRARSLVHAAKARSLMEVEPEPSRDR